MAMLAVFSLRLTMCSLLHYDIVASPEPAGPVDGARHMLRLQFGACPDYSESTDSAEDAAVCELAVQPGDVLLAGSDGLWDNCYDEELLRLLPASPEAAEQARPLPAVPGMM